MSHSEAIPGRLRARLRVAVAGLVAALALSAPAITAADPGNSNGKREGADPVRVMTRNLYLGADLTGALRAPNFVAFTDEVGEIYNDVNATNFPVRAESLAQEIQSKRADLVGLQEVTTWRIGVPPDGPPSAGGTPAEQELYDFLGTLLAELNSNGTPKDRRYRAVIVDQTADIEAPADAFPGNESPSNPLGLDLDLRLTIGNAILVRKGAGVKVSDVESGIFGAQLVVPIASPPGAPPASASLNRGWESLDASVRGAKFHFVNTHLEAFDSAANVGPALAGRIREAQAKELVAPGGPATSSLPVVLLGDLNSDVPGVRPGDQLAYQALLDAGFQDRGVDPPVFSCCYPTELLDDPNDALDHTVDHVLTDSSSVKPGGASIATTFADGLWSSDHAGVASDLRFGR